jgi:16S rRNA processing protein RimM
MHGVPPKVLIVGRLAGVLGIAGWLRVRSYTEPPENIVTFETWTLMRDVQRTRVRLEDGRRHGKGVAAKLEGIDDVETARRWVGADIEVERSALPACEPGEYYWVDLIGMRVETLDRKHLGVVDRLLSTGPHDVLVVTGDRERLIPVAHGRTLHKVDLAAGVIVVDWDPSY